MMVKEKNIRNLKLESLPSTLVSAGDRAFPSGLTHSVVGGRAGGHQEGGVRVDVMGGGGCGEWGRQAFREGTPAAALPGLSAAPGSCHSVVQISRRSCGCSDVYGIAH